MFSTKKSSADVKTYLTGNKWEIGDLFPGPEGFYPGKTSTPHLHFTMQAGNCYLHYKTAGGTHEINSYADVAASGATGQNKTEAQGLMVELTMG
ncbi:MAG TPA: hypothetical protein VFF00_06780 [Candidatus Elarobacter sp.]|nr:hypothetical protein [Dongiaceae bacterium]HZW53720.1 hypothetical protein [Candidatus Elarobacter sp.]